MLAVACKDLGTQRDLSNWIYLIKFINLAIVGKGQKMSFSNVCEYPYFRNFVKMICSHRLLEAAAHNSEH